MTARILLRPQTALFSVIGAVVAMLAVTVIAAPSWSASTFPTPQQVSASLGGDWRGWQAHRPRPRLEGMIGGKNTRCAAPYVPSKVAQPSSSRRKIYRGSPAGDNQRSASVWRLDYETPRTARRILRQTRSWPNECPRYWESFFRYDQRRVAAPKVGQASVALARWECAFEGYAPSCGASTSVVARRGSVVIVANYGLYDGSGPSDRPFTANPRKTALFARAALRAAT